MTTGGVAFVTFTSSDHALQCLRSMPANRWTAKIPCRKGKRLKIDGTLVFGKEAPDPEDIKWENLEFTTSQQMRQWIWHTLVAGLAVCFGTVILIICATIQYYAKQNKTLKKIMSGAIGVVVTMTTGAMTSVVKKLSDKEKVHTISEMKAVFVQRSVFLSFCLGPVMTFVVPFFTGQVRLDIYVRCCYSANSAAITTAFLVHA